MKIDNNFEVVEEYVELLIKPFFDYGLIKGTADSISRVLEKQYEEGEFRELGGTMFCNGESIEFRLIHPIETKSLEDTLDKFEKGEEVNLEKVVGFVRDKYEFEKKHSGEDDPIVIMLENVYLAFSYLNENRERIPLADSSKREGMTTIFKKYVLGTTFLVSLFELGVKDKGFLASFHVHRSGQPPSEEDLKTSAELPIPMIVISATKDYESEGIKLYITYNGKYDLLYEGLIKPKN